MKFQHQTSILIVCLFALFSFFTATCDNEPGWMQGDTDGNTDTDGDSDGDTDGDSDGDSDTEPTGPWVNIDFPDDGGEADNPVTFEFTASEEVTEVFFDCEGWPLHDDPIPSNAETLTYNFNGANTVRHITLTGHNSGGEVIATDEIDFTPISCRIPDEPGFNHYTIKTINDWTLYPKDGTYVYCWGEDWCGDMWGQIHDGYYAGEMIFPGGGDCFCSGHTLEIFLGAYRLWQEENSVSEDTLFEVSGSTLTVDEVDVGDFYQYWQGFGVTTYASSADAFEQAGIGENIYEENWNEVMAGDYVNLSRTTGSGHAVIFVDWIEEGDEKIGLRYYGCNGSGASCPDPNDPLNTSGNSGPSFITEYFDGYYGGTVIPAYLFIGRVFLP